MARSIAVRARSGPVATRLRKVKPIVCPSEECRFDPICDRPSAGLELIPIGVVESTLEDRAAAPKQGNEGAPDAWLVIDESVAEGLDGLRSGDEIFVLTWLHQSRRDVLRVHPRDDLTNPERGVFSTRSSERPNPIGLHRVKIVGIEGGRFRVRNLEAVNGTPIVDIKPVIRADETNA